MPLSRGQERKLIVWSYRSPGKNNNWNILKLPFTIFEMNPSDFKGITVLSESKRKLQITNYIWMEMTADDPVTNCVRKSHNILMP
ncbi:hypothetical protein PR048_027784 [Dryococelus australis]|uniref:Uncharacterized protein n=1 Tax=Dryococelus australis TaxID=614101 RepID=A0ABQ9GHH9_9NEOP|nr:hypothetical protein PR048_027784 [Dryococelus australis]